jgi:serine/threonine protein kinase
VGTYGYIAPEIAMRKEYNETVDLYSLGCTLNNVSRGSRDDMSNELKYIFGKMCSSKPNSRYQSASEALKKLDNATLRRGKESKLVSLFYKGKLLSGEVHEFPANKLGLSDSTLGSGFDDGTVEPRKSDSGWQPVAFDYDNTFDERLKYGRYKNDKQPIESIETIEPKASIEPIEPKAPKKPNRAVPYGRVKEASIDKYDTTVAEWVFMREINNDIDVNKRKQTVINNIDVNNMFGRYNNDLE